MKHTVIRALTVLLLIACLIPLMTACGGDFRDDLTSTTVMDTVKAAVPAEGGYEVAGNGYINGSNWGEEYEDMLDRLTDYRILVATDTSNNINELGILRAKSTGDAKAVKSVVDDYLAATTARQKPLLEGYNPTEIPKLENAKVTVCGTYVFYTILDTDMTATAHEAFENAVKAE